MWTSYESIFNIAPLAFNAFISILELKFYKIGSVYCFPRFQVSRFRSLNFSDDFK